MSPLIHFIVGWLVTIGFSLKLNERRLVVFFAVIADIDGVFFLYSNDLYLKYHHTFGHSFIIIAPIVIVLSFIFFRKNHIKVTLLALLAFTSHLFLDIFVTNWPVYPLYPLSNISFSIYPTLSAGTIYNILDALVSLISLVLLLVAVMIVEKSPLELISPRLDNAILGCAVFPLKRKCNLCDKRAFNRCLKCGNYYCHKHMNDMLAPGCKKCGGIKSKN